MAYSVHDLLSLLDLEPLEHNIYRGRNRDIGTGRVFGGQVLAQALVAARRTVDDERVAHSIHGYFILPGDIGSPIVYFVDRLRDGKSFTTRRVTAIQHGRAIFNMSASFQVLEAGPEHQVEMPAVPPPEELQPELEQVRERVAHLPQPLRSVLTQDRPIDFRQVTPFNPFQPVRSEPRRMLWLRAISGVAGRDGDLAPGRGRAPAVRPQIPQFEDPLLNQAVLAYASDYGLLATALLPHALSIYQPGVQVATLDHAIWFHRPFRVDDWLLYVMDSPSAFGARGFARGLVFSRAGELVASVAQEGLTRVWQE